MEHRHLDGARLSTAAVASILERGRAADLRDLLTELKRDPHGAVASAALRAADSSDVYGYPELLRACLDTWRRQTATTDAGSS
jgi:threonine aldolase